MSDGYLPWSRPDSVMSRPCLRDARHELSYADVARRAEAVAEQLSEHGVGEGDVIAVMLPNRVELLLTLLAAWRLGAAVTPVNPAFTANEAEYQLRDADAVLVVTAGPDTPTAGLPSIPVDALRAEPGGGHHGASVAVVRGSERPSDLVQYALAGEADTPVLAVGGVATTDGGAGLPQSLGAVLARENGTRSARAARGSPICTRSASPRPVPR